MLEAATGGTVSGEPPEAVEDPDEQRMHIGDVAERTGLSLRTIRYYEDVGLLPPSERSSGGFRLYTEDAVNRLLVIRQMKPLDFSLDEMRELLTTLDALDEPDVDEQGLDELREVVLRFEREVGERIVKLSRKLDNARLFHASLDERAGALSRAVSRPPSAERV